jgi:hypothetical protein
MDSDTLSQCLGSLLSDSVSENLVLAADEIESVKFSQFPVALILNVDKR